MIDGEKMANLVEEEFDLDFVLFLFSAQIDKLCGEMQDLMRSFSTKEEEEPVASMFASEYILHQIPTLQSISKNIRGFRASYKSKSATEMEKLKSISYRDQPATEMEEKIEEGMDGGKSSTEVDEEEEEEEEEEVEEGSGREEVEGDAVRGGGKSATEVQAALEEEEFADYRESWELSYGNGNGNSFEDLTLLSPMLFTHCTPGRIPVDADVGSTLQIYSIKVTEIKHFKWPLEVYGVVAARDVVDQHRNPLFLRPRNRNQILNQEDPFLHLTGPCRAIVSVETVDIEIQLIVKGRTKSEDRALISQVFPYNNYGDSLRTSLIDNHFCTIELCAEQLDRSVQATIYGVHVIDGESSPFQYGFRVACSSLPRGSIEDAIEPPSKEVVLLDSKDPRMAMTRRGYLDLSRQVVSVQLLGKLKVLIQAYSPSGDVAAHGHVFITPKSCNSSQHICDLGGSKVDIAVAWSLLVEDKTLILMNGCVDPLAVLPPVCPCE